MIHATNFSPKGMFGPGVEVWDLPQQIIFTLSLLNWVF
jgi:hypothetical protein